MAKDVPDYGFVAGVPARQSGWMSRHGHLLNFDEASTATCPESGLRFEISAAGDAVRCIDLDEEAALPEELSRGEKSYGDFKE